jgi:hypothetical protein
VIRTGDTVYFSTRDGAQQIAATVLLASPNGRSLMLTFEAVVETPSGVYVGNMPVLQLEDGRWIEIVGQHEIRIEQPI